VPASIPAQIIIGLPYLVTWQRRSLTEEQRSAVYAGILHGAYGSHELG